MRTLHQRTIDVAAVCVVAASAERVGVVRPTPTKPSEVVDAAAPRHVLDFEIPLEGVVRELCMDRVTDRADRAKGWDEGVEERQ